MKKTDLAYFAGIFDGEGCIQIIRYKRGKSSHYGLLCTVVNTNEWLEQSLRMAFGGSVHKQKPRSEKHRMAWCWSISARAAQSFLKAIYPYLRLKKPQVDVALEFQKQRIHPGKKLTSGERAIQEAQKILLKGLKKE